MKGCEVVKIPPRIEYGTYCLYVKLIQGNILATKDWKNSISENVFNALMVYQDTQNTGILPDLPYLISKEKQWGEGGER